MIKQVSLTRDIIGVVSWLMHLTPEEAVQVWALAEDTLLSVSLSLSRSIIGYRQIEGETKQIVGEWPLMD